MGASAPRGLSRCKPNTVTASSSLSNLFPHPSIPTHSSSLCARSLSPSRAMALLAIQGMAMSAAALPSHHHGAISSSVSTSSYALATTVAFPRPRTTLAVGVVTPVLDVYCGRGDKKTKRGKRFNHSYGNARPRNKKKGTGPPRLFAPPAPPRKDQFDDGEIIPIEIDEDILE